MAVQLSSQDNYDTWFPEKVKIEVSPEKHSVDARLESVSFTFTLEKEGLYLSYFPSRVAKEFTLKIKVTELTTPNTKYKPVLITISPIEGLKFADEKLLDIETKLGILSTVRIDTNDELHAVNEAKITVKVKHRSRLICSKKGKRSIHIKFESTDNEPGKIFNGVVVNQKILDLLEKANMIEPIEGKRNTYKGNKKFGHFFIMNLCINKEPCVAVMWGLLDYIGKLLTQTPADLKGQKPVIDLFLSICEKRCARNLLWLHFLTHRVIYENQQNSPLQKMLNTLTRTNSSVIQQEFLANMQTRRAKDTRANDFYLEKVKSVYPFVLNPDDRIEKLQHVEKDNNFVIENENSPICENYHDETKHEQECYVDVTDRESSAYVGGILFDIHLRDTGLYIKYRPGEVVKELKYQIDVLQSYKLKYKRMYLTVKRFKGLEWLEDATRYGWEEHHLLETVSTKNMKRVDECHSNRIRIKISLAEDWNPMQVKTVSDESDRMIFEYRFKRKTYRTIVYRELIDFEKLKMIRLYNRKRELRMKDVTSHFIKYRKTPYQLRTLLQYLTYENVNDTGMKLAFESCAGQILNDLVRENQKKVIKKWIQSREKEGAKMMLYGLKHGLCEDAMKMIYICRIQSRKNSMKFQMDYMRYSQIGTLADREELTNMFDKVTEWMNDPTDPIERARLTTPEKAAIRNRRWNDPSSEMDSSMGTGEQDEAAYQPNRLYQRNARSIFNQGSRSLIRLEKNN